MTSQDRLRKARRRPASLAALVLGCLVALGPTGTRAQEQSPPAAPSGPVSPGPDWAEVDRLFAELAGPEVENWRRIEDAIALQWSRSGSAAMDLLLQRGREALEDGDTTAALQHFGALTDHAPDFAEGWNARATAHFRAERYGAAMEDIARTLALEPRHYPAMIGLATILREVGREADALAVLREVHKLNPHRESVTRGIEELSRQLDGQPL